MTCYIVTFETRSEGSKKAVETFLTTYESCPIHASCWAIMTDKSAVFIRDALRNLSEPPHYVFVVRSGTESAWTSYGKKTNDWLKENL